MSDQDTKRQNAGHDETKPTSGFIGRAAQAVVSFCTLPDRRSVKKDERWFYERWSDDLFGPNEADAREQCIDNRITVKAHESHVPMPAKNSAVYRHILRHVDDMTKTGIAQCQTRDIPNHIDNNEYYGYRNGNGQCAVTTDRRTAEDARKRYSQNPPR